MKQKALRLLAALSAAALLAVPASFSAAAAPSLSGRSDFVFGVTGHPNGYEAYPEKYLQEQIRLAAELGSNIYRFNYTPHDSLDEFEYLDKVVSYADAYGMKLMLVMDAAVGDTEAIRDNARTIAKRYKGKIPYYQAMNELDNASILGPHVDGSQKEHFDQMKLASNVANVKAMCEGLREGDPDAEIVINFAYVHYYFLDALHEAEVPFDIIGWDQYSNAGWDVTKNAIPKILSYGKPVIVCETNLADGRVDNAEEERLEWLETFMNYFYNYDSPLMRGFIIYELLDEPAMEAVHPEIGYEAHYGLVRCERDGTIIGPKQTYYAVQKWWGGKDLSHIEVPDLDSEPEPTTTTAPPKKTTTTRQAAQAPTTAAPLTTTEGTTETTQATETTISTIASTAAATTSSAAPAAGPTEPADKENGLPIWPFVTGGIAVVLLAAGGVFLWLWKAGKLASLFPKRHNGTKP